MRADKESPTNVLAGILHRDDILLDLDVISKRRLFEEVGSFFHDRHALSKAQVEDSLGKRENLGSTGLGQGVAIPHARIRNLDRAIGAFVRTRSPISFDAPDGKPVSEIFVLLVPEKATEMHLQILAAVAQTFGDRIFREKLRMCVTASEVYQLFCEPQPS